MISNMNLCFHMIFFNRAACLEATLECDHNINYAFKCCKCYVIITRKNK